MRWYVIIKIKVLCPRSGSHRQVKQNDNLCLVEDSGSMALLKVKAREQSHYKGPLGYLLHTVTFLVLQISFSLAGNQQRQEILIEFHYEQNQIMPLGVIGPCFQICFNLADNWIGMKSRLVQLWAKSDCTIRSYMPLSIFALGSMGISKMYIFKVSRPILIKFNV